MKSIQPSRPDFGEGAGRKKMRVGRMQMIVGRVGAAARAEAVAVFLRHARRDRRMIFHHMAVAVDDFMFFVAHGPVSPFLAVTLSRRQRIWILQLSP